MNVKQTIIKTLAILGLWGMMVSCTSEELTPDQNPYRDGMVPLDIPITKAVNDQDDKTIGKVRLIVIKNSMVTNNRLIDATDSTEVRFQETVPLGTVDYFLIANELPAWGLDGLSVNSIVFTNVLKKKILSFSAYPVVNTTTDLIPMLQFYEGLEIKDELMTGNGKAYSEGVEVTATIGRIVRLYARATLVLNCKYSELANGGDPIELESISIKQMPRESYLVQDHYIKNGVAHFFNGDTTGVIKPANYSLTDSTFSGNFSFYIPEHLVADTANRTYWSAIVRLINSPETKREYKIVLGDSIVHNNNENMLKYAGRQALRVNRNTHYGITARIKSFEDTSEKDMELVAKIIPWNEIDLSQVEQIQYFLDLSQSKFKIGTSVGTTTNPYEGTVNISTSYPSGWTVSSYSAGVTILETSSDKLRFRIASTASSWTIDVTAGVITKQITITR